MATTEGFPKKNTMKSTQDLIEDGLLRFCRQGVFEALLVFNDEGIPMAEVGHAAHYNKDALAALTVILSQSAELIEDFHVDTLVDEISLRTTNKFRIVGRLFQTTSVKLILIAIIPQKLPYRKITNDAVQMIQHIMQD